MRGRGATLLAAAALTVAFAAPARAQGARVVDVPTRAGVTQRVLLVTSSGPRAAVVLFAGGHGGLQIQPSGSLTWGAGNFLVRSRGLFAAQGLVVAVIDAPSDRQNLSGFRQSREHVADVGAVIGWLRKETGAPVWLIGTSRGTQSVAFVATQLRGAEGPDGIVLTSTVLTDRPGSRPVPEMALERISVPTLVVHHRHDGCEHCRYVDLPRLTDQLTGAPRRELITIEGGTSRGDPCEAFAYHGYNGREADVVAAIAQWITAEPKR
jgi:pimeloyl-ACP methyl ester carboxylesterase